MHAPPLFSLLLAGALVAHQSPLHADSEATLLPLRRARLYEVGIGYFERRGELREKQSLGLSLPSNQLDDALKSLVILSDAERSKITSIEFEARESPGLARAEASLPDDPNAPLGFAQVLRGFRGVDVEVRRNAGSVRGRLVDVISLEQADAERCLLQSPPLAPPSTSKTACTEVRDANLVLLDAHGTLSRLPLSQVESVRALQPSVAARLTRALDAVTQPNGAPTRRLLRVHGTGARTLGLGYVAEAPVWRASYRLLLDDLAQSGKIQGFALVHNDTDEAWRGVRLELANGRPSSFLYPLAAARYARRALVTPDEPLSTVPQLLGKSADELWNDEASESEVIGAGGLGLSGVGEGGGGRGEGIGLGAVGTIGHGAGSSDLLDVGHLANLAGSVGVEGAAQFTYKIAEPVDLGAHSSALVPFMAETVSLTRVTWFETDEAGETAVRLLNSSSQTLPAGVLSVFAESGFSGSSLLVRTKPGEVRMLRFGRDLDVELAREVRGERSEPKLYSFENGQLSEHSLHHSEIAFRLSNKSGHERTVSASLTVVPNARVEGADDAAYDATLGRGWVSFQLPARTKVTRNVRVVQGVRARIEADATTAEFLKHAASLASVDPAQRPILARASEQMGGVELRRRTLTRLKAELEQELADITRLAGHVRALGSSSDEGELAARRLRLSEDRLRQLRQRVQAVSQEIGEFTGRTRQILGTLGGQKALPVERGLRDAAPGG
jgi:uncharacterized protein DUF4139